MSSRSSDRRLAYSSDTGAVRYCRRCGQPAHEGRCAPDSGGGAVQSASDGIVRVARDKHGRGGKLVTVVSGVPGTDAERDAIAQKLKKLCGAGGTRKDDAIEVQGEQREKIAAYLTAQGYRVKLVGG